jgi:ABC-type glycerol-3-phosphate transport system substrate-binding protein
MSELSDEADIVAHLPHISKARNIELINLSAGSPAYEIMEGEGEAVRMWASSGWLEPLDEYIEKYRDEFGLDEIPDSTWDVARINGKIYGIPYNQNSQVFFYRKDLFENSGLEAPKSYQDYIEAAKKLTREGRYGTALTFIPKSMIQTYHWFLHGHGGKWFDEDWKPAFNSAAGIKAIETMKNLISFAPSDVLAYGNDECMVGMQQNRIATTHQWGSRCKPMDDTKVSQVVGLVDFAISPHDVGAPTGAIYLVNFFVIPKGVEQDKELIFRTLCQGVLSKIAQDRAAEAGELPIRIDVLTNPLWTSKNRHWPTLLENIQKGAIPSPGLPYWGDLQLRIESGIMRIFAEDLPIEETLDSIAQMAYEFQKEQGQFE